MDVTYHPWRMASWPADTMRTLPLPAAREGHQVQGAVGQKARAVFVENHHPALFTPCSDIYRCADIDFRTDSKP